MICFPQKDIFPKRYHTKYIYTHIYIYIFFLLGAENCCKLCTETINKQGGSWCPGNSRHVVNQRILLFYSPKLRFEPKKKLLSYIETDMAPWMLTSLNQVIKVYKNKQFCCLDKTSMDVRFK